MTCRTVFFLSDLRVGGAERQTLALAQRLRQSGYDVHIVAHYPKCSPSVASDDVLSMVTFLDGFRLRHAGGWMRAWRTLKALDGDVVVAVSTTPAIIAALGKRLGRFRGKLLCTFHTTDLIDGREPAEFKLFRLATRALDCLVHVSVNQRRKWDSEGLRARRVAVIPNGVDVDHFAGSGNAIDKLKARKRIGLQPKDYVIGITAALRPEKNHCQLLDALQHLRTKGLPAKVVVVGDGPTRAAIEERTHALGLGDAVILAGEQRDIRTFVTAMDVGVLCSTSVETLSLAALETMSMGVPMVLSDIGGASEIVLDGVDGRLFPAGDTDALVSCLVDLSESAFRMSMGAAAARKIRAQFTIERMVADYEALFAETLAERNPAEQRMHAGSI